MRAQASHHEPRGQGRRWRATALVAALAILGSSTPAQAHDPDEELHGVEYQLSVYLAAADAAPCDLDWSILGGIAGFVSDHGRFGQNDDPELHTEHEAIEQVGSLWVARVESTMPIPIPIRGEALDGRGGRLLIDDSDAGDLDGDTEYDRAMGPFQFIPATWELYATDGDGDEQADPDNIVDAAAAAAWFLCDLGADEDERKALIGYFGTDTWLEHVAEAEAEIRDFERRTRPVIRVAGEVIEANVPLITVGGISVNVDIADDVRAMLDAAEADGITLRGWGWRSHARQIELRQAHCADVWETPASQCSPPTAKPGQSLHETGHAIDFYIGTGNAITAVTRSSDVFIWLSENAADFGFYNLPSEPWHWSITGG